ncbi:hypothetical protein ACFV0Q_41085, partial [Streptomyces sp. NPDC059564]
MSGGQRKLAEHPVLVVVGVIATIIGAVAAGKDLFSAEDPPPRAAESVPAAPRPAATPDDGDGGGAPAPSTTRKRTVEPEPEPVPETTEPEGPRPEPEAPV